MFVILVLPQFLESPLAGEGMLFSLVRNSHSFSDEGNLIPDSQGKKKGAQQMDNSSPFFS